MLPYADSMAKECAITGKRSRVGGGYSNRTRATQFNPTGKRRRQVNIQKKKLFIPELKKSVTVNISAKGLKTVRKRGAFATLKKAGLL
jgi:large subunit ribosomal protein L28